MASADNSGSNNELSKAFNSSTTDKQPMLGKRRRNGRSVSLEKMKNQTNKNNNNALAGIMNSTEIINGTQSNKTNNKNSIEQKNKRTKKRANLEGGKKKIKTTRKRKHKSKRKTKKRH